MAIKSSRQDSTERKRISAELAASEGATTSSTEAGPGGGKRVSEFTATEFLERVIRYAEERRVFEDVSAVYDSGVSDSASVSADNNRLVSGDESP